MQKDERDFVVHQSQMKFKLEFKCNRSVHNKQRTSTILLWRHFGTHTHINRLSAQQHSTDVSTAHAGKRPIDWHKIQSQSVDILSGFGKFEKFLPQNQHKWIPCN